VTQPGLGAHPSYAGLLQTTFTLPGRLGEVVHNFEAAAQVVEADETAPATTAANATRRVTIRAGRDPVPPRFFAAPCAHDWAGRKSPELAGGGLYAS